MDLHEKKELIYTAYSKHFYYAKMLISSYVLNNDSIPLNPFSNWCYYMDDMVDRKYVKRANNNLIMTSNQVWVFGPISDGVLEEIRLAYAKKKKLKFFSIGKRYSDIYEIDYTKLVFEEELLLVNNKNILIEEICSYI